MLCMLFGKSERPSLLTKDPVVRSVDLKFLLKSKIDPNYNTCKSQNYMLEHESSLNKNNSEEQTEIQPGSFWQASLKSRKKKQSKKFYWEVFMTELCFTRGNLFEGITIPGFTTRGCFWGWGSSIISVFLWPGR